jgi:arylsulfatase A-like enzyme
VNFGLEPLFAVSPADRDYLSRRYDGDILFWDRAFQELVEELRRRELLDRTIVIVTSDHGEEFLEHGMVKHGPQLYQESIHVPLLVRDPRDLTEGRRRPQLFELKNLPALVLGLLDLPGRGEIGPATGSEGAGTAGFSYASTAIEPENPWPRQRISSIIVAEWKLIRWLDTDRVELYNLADDPAEVHNLAPVQPKVVQRLVAVLDERLRHEHQPSPEPEIDPDDIEELRALGYVQ